jgi:hypothetical protein
MITGKTTGSGGHACILMKAMFPSVSGSASEISAFMPHGKAGTDSYARMVLFKTKKASRMGPPSQTETVLRTSGGGSPQTDRIAFSCFYRKSM